MLWPHACLSYCTCSDWASSLLGKPYNKDKDLHLWIIILPWHSKPGSRKAALFIQLYHYLHSPAPSHWTPADKSRNEMPCWRGRRCLEPLALSPHQLLLGPLGPDVPKQASKNGSCTSLAYMKSHVLSCSAGVVHNHICLSTSTPLNTMWGCRKLALIILFRFTFL